VQTYRGPDRLGGETTGAYQAAALGGRPLPMHPSVAASVIFAPALWNCASMSRFRHLRVLCARSDCLRKQVGAVLVSRDHRIVSTG
jgi:hypothetical protein